jgi:hypothetical protein
MAYFGNIMAGDNLAQVYRYDGSTAISNELFLFSGMYETP